YLGDDFMVRSTKGHFADIPTGADAVDVANGFHVNYEVLQESRSILESLASDLGRCSRLVLATDADREGEMIAALLVDFLQPSVPVERITFHAVTETAIREALETPRTIDADLVAAARTRRVLDRLFGYGVTDVMRRKVRYDTTAGRVQSPALRLIVEREYERQAFRPATYFDVEATVDCVPATTATLVAVDGVPVASGRHFDQHGRLTEAVERLDQASAEKIAGELIGTSLEVVNVETTTRSIKPPTPFVLSTLVQEASGRLGIGSKELEMISSELFNRGHITYVRTDNPVHEPSSRTEIRTLIAATYGSQWVEPTERFTSSGRKSVQGAHEAIRPTHLERIEPADLTARQLDVYRLVWQRTVASQMVDARRITTTVTGRATVDGRVCDFRFSGSTYAERGFLMVYPSGRDDVEIPDVAIGDRLGVGAAEAVVHRTKPPARYTEASLVKTLEELGIGRPSTYVAIVKKLREGYVWSRRGDRALIPTLTAFAAHRVLSGFFADLISDDFTSGLEERLDRVSTGDLSAESVLEGFYRGELPDRPGLETLIRTVTDELDPREVYVVSLGPHPTTGEEVVVRAGRSDAKGARPYVKIGDRNLPLSDQTDLDDLGAEVLVELLALPRVLGRDPETGQEIIANVGRWGAYVDREGQSASVDRLSRLLTLSVDEARALIEKRAERSARRESSTPSTRPRSSRRRR
ncbi:MAG: type I DNA topoisomerase, partial [Actinomycetota bacterium]